VPKRRLGQGLSALLSSYQEEQPAVSGGVEQIPIEQIQPNPFQPRKAFDRDSLEELKASIKEKGLVQPITVRPVDGGYELIAGERRWRACKELGMREIPAYIMQVDTAVDMMELALIENLQRDNLNPLEEAEAYSLLHGKYQLSHDDIGRHLGKSRAAITNTLRLLKLPPEIKQGLRNLTISAGHARALLGLESSRTQVNVYRRILREKLSVRETERLIGRLKKARGSATKKVQVRRVDAELGMLEERLRDKLGTKVKITKGPSKGTISIEYYGAEDLNRIIELILGETL